MVIELVNHGGWVPEMTNKMGISMVLPPKWVASHHLPSIPTRGGRYDGHTQIISNILLLLYSVHIMRCSQVTRVFDPAILREEGLPRVTQETPGVFGKKKLEELLVHEQELLIMNAGSAAATETKSEEQIAFTGFGLTTFVWLTPSRLPKHGLRLFTNNCQIINSIMSSLGIVCLQDVILGMSLLHASWLDASGLVWLGLFENGCTSVLSPKNDRFIEGLPWFAY